VTLDTVITDDLRLEGLVRNVSRKVNDLRKQAGLASTIASVSWSRPTAISAAPSRPTATT